MAEPFLSEIRSMSFVYAPRGWALCNGYGQLLPINQFQSQRSTLVEAITDLTQHLTSQVHAKQRPVRVTTRGQRASQGSVFGVLGHHRIRSAESVSPIARPAIVRGVRSRHAPG